MRYLYTVLFLMILSSQVFGQATANSDGNWSDTGSWQGGNIGDGGETVVMNANIDLTILDGESFTISSINVGKNGSITINSGGTLILNGTFIADKEFTINVDGTFTINGDMDVAKDLTLNVTGTMTVDGSISMAKDATLTVDGSLGVTGSVTSAKDAVVTVDGSMSVDGDLNLGTGSVILGTGPVSTGTCSGAACGDSQLPVELVEFKVEVIEHFVSVYWSTLTEENNDYFTIERSTNGVDFEEIAQILGHGTTTQRQDYTFTDKSPYSGISYYRLRQTDYDGKFEEFEIKVVQYSTIDRLNIYPNPSNQGDVLRIVTGAMPEETIQLEVFDQSGRIMTQQTTSGAYTNITLDADANPGVYILRMTSGKIVKTSRIIIR